VQGFLPVSKDFGGKLGSPGSWTTRGCAPGCASEGSAQSEEPAAGEGSRLEKARNSSARGKFIAWLLEPRHRFRFNVLLKVTI
jgi:hypothetical protein